MAFAENTNYLADNNNTLASNTLHDFRLSIHFALLKGNDFISFVSPVDGFINIMLVEGNGASTYVVRDTSYIIRCGENMLHLINNEEQFKWKNMCDDAIAMLLFIPAVILQEFHNKISSQSLRFANGYMTSSDQRLNLVIKQVLDLCAQASPLNSLRIQALLTEALVHQIEGLYAENEQQEIISNKGHYDKILLAKKLIEEDLSKNFTIHELAKAIGTNEQYLKVYFKQHFGKTVMKYITETKMEHAKNLIMSGDYRVSDVARLTGYKHSTHFTTAFKKYFGFIPNSLRYTFLVAHEGAKLLTDFEGFIGMF